MPTMLPLAALRAWMFAFTDYVAGKVLILPALDTVPGGSTRRIEGTRGLIQTTLRELVERALHAGQLRGDVDPDDMIRALIGIFRRLIEGVGIWCAGLLTFRLKDRDRDLTPHKH